MTLMRLTMPILLNPLIPLNFRKARRPPKQPLRPRRNRDRHPVERSFPWIATDAEHQFRQAIVAIDALPGNQVEGISPLYHVSQVDDYPDKMAAVMQISTRMDARELIGALESVSSSISDDLDLDLVDMEGVVRNEPDCMVPWPSAREHAAVLAPWFDMDPDAKLGRDPVAFLLAMAPDAAQVGMLTDNLIIGDTL